MPNQRDENKRIMTVWMDSEMKTALEKAAKKSGKCMTEFTLDAIKKAMDSEDRNSIPKPNSKRTSKSKKAIKK